MLTEPESHVVHERRQTVLAERECSSWSGPDRMLQELARALASARLAVRRARVRAAVSASRPSPSAPRGCPHQLVASAEAGARARVPRGGNR